MGTELAQGIKRTGGARFDPAECPLYFLASNIPTFQLGVPERYPSLLVALNEITRDDYLEVMEGWVHAQGTRLFLDSGIFVLCADYSREHGIPLNEVFGMAPESVPGFEAHFQRYVSVVKRLEPLLWGYIELDLGGEAGKTATRTRLEALGLRPIPVYHPFNDPPEYFDTLASQYDRICIGNLVKASSTARKRLMATLWQKAQAYPHLWIHLLGLSPNQWFNAYPHQSSDSSGWLSGLRWTNSDRERAALKTCGEMGRDFAYQRGVDQECPVGHTKATQILAYRAHMNLRNWRNHVAALKRLSSNDQT